MVTSRARRPRNSQATLGLQQAVITEVGLLALRTPELSTLMTQVLERVTRTLDVQVGAILELLKDRHALHLCTGVGCDTGTIGQFSFESISDTWTFADQPSERALFEQLRVVTGVTAAIGNPVRSWGVLVAGTRYPHRFTKEDIHFLQAVANVLAGAIDRQQTEAKLRESEERFRQLAENITEVFWLTNPAMTEIYYVSPAYREVWGCPCEGLYADPSSWLYAIHPDDRDRVARTAKEKLTEGVGEYDEEFRIVRPDGSIRWIRDRGFPIFDRAGNLTRIAGISQDITKRKEAELVLRDTNETLAALINASPVAITILDPDGCCRLWNPAAERLFGWTADEVVGRPLPTVPPDKLEEHQGFCARILHDQAFTDLEVIRQRKDGTLIPVSLSTAALHDIRGHVRGLIGLQVDISERKQAEARLHESYRLLRTVSRHLERVREEERSRIAREVHDELGVTLTCLKIDLSRLLATRHAREDQLRPSQNPDQISDMIGLVDDMIKTVQRIATELRPRVLDDLGLVAAIQWQAEDYHRRTGIHCDVHSSAEEVPIEREQATALFRICQEALTNTARHSGARTVVIRLTESDGHLLLVVTDDGKGIPEDKINDPRSLGLLGIRERAELAGGRLEISGTFGKGTRISVKIPTHSPQLST